MENYWREGPGELSLNEACRRANVSKPALYREFGSEDGLMDAVLVRYIDTVFAALADLIGEPRPFPEILRDLVMVMTEDEERVTPAGCLIVKMGADASKFGPLTQARLEAFNAQRRAVFLEWIRGAQGRNEINAEVSADLAASYLETKLGTILNQAAAGAARDEMRAQAALAFAALTRMTEAPLWVGVPAGAD